MGKMLKFSNVDYSNNKIVNAYDECHVANAVLSITSNSGGRVNVNDSNSGKRLCISQSESTNNFFGIYVPANKTITLRGVEGLALDYCYLSQQEVQKLNNSSQGRNPYLVGTGSEFDSSNYFFLNPNGASNTVSVTNEYGNGYYFAFTAKKPDGTALSASDYNIEYIVQ